MVGDWGVSETEGRRNETGRVRKGWREGGREDHRGLETAGTRERDGEKERWKTRKRQCDERV